jgi:Icc protein
MRIAHISDLHLNPDYFPERTEAFYQILEKCRSLKVDHIVITGDITNQAKAKEFAHARTILKEFDLLNPAKLTVTIGNHDIYGGPYHAEDVLSFPGFCKGTDYDSKVKEFYSSFRETFDDCKYVSGTSVFPFVKIIRDVAFVGINSVAQWSSIKNPLGSNGDVGKHQYQQLKKIFESEIVKGKTILVLIHHHFNKMEKKESSGKLERLWHAIESGTMKLWKKKRLFRLFNDGKIGKVLHGHLHHNADYTRKNIKFLNAGGTMFPGKESRHSFHVVDIHQQNISHSSITVSISKHIKKALVNSR